MSTEHAIDLVQIGSTGLVEARCRCGGYTSIVCEPAAAARLGRRHVRWRNSRQAMVGHV